MPENSPAQRDGDEPFSEQKKSRCETAQRASNRGILDSSRRDVLKLLGVGAIGAGALGSDAAVNRAAAASYSGPPRYSSTDMPTYGDAWTSTLIGSGGKMNGATTCPSDSNVVYMWTDVGGAWRSDDKGDRWYAMRRGFGVRTLVADPDDADVVVQAEKEGLYRSADGGDTWSHVLETRFQPNAEVQARDGAGDVIARKPDDTSYLLAAPVDDRLYRSTDGGVTWTQLQTAPDGLATTGIWFHPNRPDTVLLAYHAPNDDFSRTGVAKSTDAGETWEVVASGSTHPGGFVLDPTDDDTIYGTSWDSDTYRSTDGGDTWSTFNDGLGESPDCQAIWADSSAVYVGCDGSIYRVPGGGSSWSLYAESNEGGTVGGGPSDDYDTSNWWGGGPVDIGGVAVDQTDPDTWYMAATYAPFKSTDHGKSWTYSGVGIEEMVGMDIATDSRNDKLHCAVADTAYFRLQNDGAEIDFKRQNPPGIFALRNVMVADSNPDRVVATSWTYGPGHNEFNPNGSIFRSDDAGESWTEIANEGLPIEDSAPDFVEPQVEKYPTGVSVNPTDADEIVVAIPSSPSGSSPGAYRTTDGGGTWSKIGGLGVTDPFDTGPAGPWQVGSMIAISGAGSIVGLHRGRETSGTYYDPGTGEWSGITDALNQFGVRHVVADPNNDGRFLVADGKGVHESTDAERRGRRSLLMTPSTLPSTRTTRPGSPPRGWNAGRF